MIRFCDREVISIRIEEINRMELLNFFLNNNMNECVCVYDSDGNYIGRITYASLLKGDECAETMMDQSYVQLNEHVWEKGRAYFNQYGAGLIDEIVMLPVLNDKR